jgi:nucleoside-diphosphate-sugar epimerase
VVVHLACAELPFDCSEDSPNILHRNVSALENILYMSGLYNVGKVIVLFDYRIYGNDGEQIKREDSYLKPDTEIGRQEEIRDKLCEAYCRQGLDVVRLRTGLVYGPSKITCPDTAALRHQILPAGRSQNSKNCDMDLLIDCVFISDLIEAVVRVCMCSTSPVLNVSSGHPSTLEMFSKLNRHYWQLYCHDELSSDSDAAFPGIEITDADPANISGYFLDASKAGYEIDWTARYNLEDGIKKTINYQNRIEDHVAVSEIKTLKNNRKRLLTSGLSVFGKPFAVNLMVFFVSMAAAFLLEFRLGLVFDLLLPYIVLISSLYGTKESFTAASLAIIGRLLFFFVFANASIINLVFDVNRILYLVFYFITSYLIGRIIDGIRQKNEILVVENRKMKNDNAYLSDLYQSSLKVKEALQNTIAETEESFSRIQYIFRSFNDAAPEELTEVTVNVVAEILRTPSVSLYQSDQSGRYLHRLAVAGYNNLPSSIKIEDHSFILQTVRQMSVNVNKSLEPYCPLICAPVSAEKQRTTLLFIDGLDLMQLNQHFLNTLNSLVQLISYYLGSQQLINQYL